jgi:hypothetical protein
MWGKSTGNPDKAVQQYPDKNVLAECWTQVCLSLNFRAENKTPACMPAQNA